MIQQTTVVHIRQVPNAMYIGRSKTKPNHFGNPFSHLDLAHTIKVPDREASITAFQEWLEGNSKWAHIEPDRRAWILENLQSLKGKQLGCFCAPQSCHGDVYVTMLQQS